MTPRRRSGHSDEIETAFLNACRAELHALKPGNVHVYAPGYDMDISHFEKSATAAAPFIAHSDLAVGERVKQGVTASMEAAGCNTNLGIILLCAPLAAAAEARDPSRTLQTQLAIVLANLNKKDADDVFSAIRLANPGGLGSVETGDVRSTANEIGLLEAMRLSAKTDRIANAYISNFDDIFADHLPSLDQALEKAKQDPLADTSHTKIAWDDRAVTTLYMHMLANFPDSHIVRKYGAQSAAAVQAQARALTPAWAPLKGAARAHEKLLKFDHQLKIEGLNPGTSADFVVATLFASHLCRFAAR